MSTTHIISKIRKHVLPRLEDRIPEAALAVIADQCSYSDAWSSLWWFAWRRGTSFLPEKYLPDVEAWLHDKLLAEIDRAEHETEWQSLPPPPPEGHGRRLVKELSHAE